MSSLTLIGRNLHTSKHLTFGHCTVGVGMGHFCIFLLVDINELTPVDGAVLLFLDMIQFC